MESRVRGEMKGSCSASISVLTALEEEVKTATDKFLLTDFSGCLEICHHVVTTANSYGDYDVNTAQRLARVREAATIIGIQALAEQGLWREVIPFVEQVYTHIATCPAAIMRMCLLLHAYVKEYMICHSLINSWLDWDEHCNHPDSGNIVGIYVSNVLVPLGAFNLIPQVVDRCSSLSSNERQNLLTPRLSSPSAVDHSFVKSVCYHDLTEDTKPLMSHEKQRIDTTNKQSGYKIVSLYISLARRLWRHLARRDWCQQICRASKLFFILSFVLLALVHVQTDVTANFSRAMKVWKSAARAVNTLWKQHPARTTE